MKIPEQINLWLNAEADTPAARNAITACGIVIVTIWTGLYIFFKSYYGHSPFIIFEAAQHLLVGSGEGFLPLQIIAYSFVQPTIGHLLAYLVVLVVFIRIAYRHLTLKEFVRIYSMGIILPAVFFLLSWNVYDTEYVIYNGTKNVIYGAYAPLFVCFAVLATYKQISIKNIPRIIRAITGVSSILGVVIWAFMFIVAMDPAINRESDEIANMLLYNGLIISIILGFVTWAPSLFHVIAAWMLFRGFYAYLLLFHWTHYNLANYAIMDLTIIVSALLYSFVSRITRNYAHLSQANR